MRKESQRDEKELKKQEPEDMPHIGIHIGRMSKPFKATIPRQVCLYANAHRKASLCPEVLKAYARH